MLALAFCCKGQSTVPYHNEWIDYSKTYYKFPIINTRLCRIPKATLVAAGLGNVAAEDFQLWCNGKQVPIFITQTSGRLSDGGFIEFLAEKNDGRTDTELYQTADDQPATVKSMFSDTAWYYLTNQTGNNLRITAAANNVADTRLPADSVFNYELEYYTTGYGFIGGSGMVVSGQILRVSNFNRGKGMVASEVRKDLPASFNIANLRIWPKAQFVQLSYTVSGLTNSDRTFYVNINNSLVDSSLVSGLSLLRKQGPNIPVASFSGDKANVVITTDKSFSGTENSAISSFKLSYKRSFHFNNEILFNFSLPAAGNGNHLRIANIRQDGYDPLLYDFTNSKRYVGVRKSDSTLFLLDASSIARNLTTIDQHPTYVTSVQTLSAVQFKNYALVDNQADYIIISNKMLANSGEHDYVEDYRAYRASAAGGGFNAKVYFIDDLSEQFAFNIHRSPLAIKNFVRFATATFSVKPKFVFLLGRASHFANYSQAAKTTENVFLNTVPSYGAPPSDNLLVSENNIDPTPLVATGRLAAISGEEIKIYLEKVKQFEALNNDTSNNLTNKEWKKEVIQLIGGDNSFDASIIRNFMTRYSATLSDTLIGARVKTYTRVNNPNFGNDTKEISDRISNGAGIISYFGHSSASSIDFNLSSPDEFSNNNGKYPLFIANGCKAGNIFDFTDSRLKYYGQSLSEKFILAANKGAIAFISNSDYGILNSLNTFTGEWCKAASLNMYSKSVGEIQQAAIASVISLTGLRSFENLQNTHQVVLHADPAIVLFPTPKADFAINDSLIEVTPSNVSIADDSISVKAKIVNIGKSITDSVSILIQQAFPDGRTDTLGKFKLGAIFSADSVFLKAPVKGLFDKGDNYIIVTIDPDTTLNEITRKNNIARKKITIAEQQIRPVYPYQYAIINTTNIKLIGSTVDPAADAIRYRLQLDTTEKFNSPFLYQKDTLTKGGAVSFKPAVSWLNNQVYYWRLTPVTNDGIYNWQSSSFLLKTSSSEGMGQSHYFQHLQSTYKGISLDSSRLFHFGKTYQNLYISQSVYGYSGDEDSHFTIMVNGKADIISACIGHSIIFNVFDTTTFAPWENLTGRFGSAAYCGNGRGYNFEFSYNFAGRKKMMDFLDSIPKGMYVSARLFIDPDRYSADWTPFYDSSFVQYWQRDTLVYGKGKSLYHSLLNQGFYNIDSINKPRVFAFVFKKDDSVSFKPVSRMSAGIYDRLNASVFIPTTDSAGSITSPLFGPAKNWNQFNWSGHQFPNTMPESSAEVVLSGISNAGTPTTIATFKPGEWQHNISNISANQYPFVQLQLNTNNAIKTVPYQLDYWHALYTPVPDGALSALDYYSFKPVLLIGKDSLQLKIAFKNISNTLLDSTTVSIELGNRSGWKNNYILPKLKRLNSGDTAIINFGRALPIEAGQYYLLIEVNKQQVPLEQNAYNNIAYIPFEVKDTLVTAIIDFNAKADQQTVISSWTASQEKAVSYYQLEHGLNNIAFTELGRWPVKDTTVTSNNYSFVHTSPAKGANFYRLKIVYNDSSSQYSAVKRVDFTAFTTIISYPNPFTDRLVVAAPDANTKFEVALYNMAGQKLMTKTGTNSITLDTRLLPAGRYTLQVISGDKLKSIKVQKY